MKKNYIIVGIVVLLLVFLFVGTNVFSTEEPVVTLYKIGDNNTTCEVAENVVLEYVNTYEWSIQPTTLMYAADGRTSWIWNSEVEAYSKVGWSQLPPITIYQYGTYRELNILQEELDDYLATGIWVKTKEEAIPPKNITKNIFIKTNFTPQELEKCLSRGLKGHGQDFFEMEQKYGINSVFAISVAELESGSGTSSAFRNKNNAFGIGPGKYFSSVKAGIDYFGQLMNKPLYYGKSIGAVGSIYCVGGNWSSKVTSLMNTNYKELGY